MCVHHWKLPIEADIHTGVVEPVQRCLNCGEERPYKPVYHSKRLSTFDPSKGKKGKGKGHQTNRVNIVLVDDTHKKTEYGRVVQICSTPDCTSTVRRDGFCHRCLVAQGRR